MDTDLETLATALYVTADDLLKAHPEILPLRPRVGTVPAITDAEVLTLAAIAPLVGINTERRFLRYARKHLTGMFPYIPGQSGYNKRLRALAGTIGWLAAWWLGVGEASGVSRVVSSHHVIKPEASGAQDRRTR